jgi:flagellar protein FlgJ
MEIKATPIPDLATVRPVTDPGSLRRLQSIEDPRSRAEAVADQIESVFMDMVMKAMRATVPEGGLLGKGLGGSMYVEMLDQELSRLGAAPRDPRFHDALVRQMMQSSVDPAAAATESFNDPMNPAPINPEESSQAG